MGVAQLELGVSGQNTASGIIAFPLTEKQSSWRRCLQIQRPAIATEHPSEATYLLYDIIGDCVARDLDERRHGV